MAAACRTRSPATRGLYSFRATKRPPRLRTPEGRLKRRPSYVPLLLMDACSQQRRAACDHSAQQKTSPPQDTRRPVEEATQQRTLLNPEECEQQASFRVELGQRRWPLFLFPLTLFLFAVRMPHARPGRCTSKCKSLPLDFHWNSQNACEYTFNVSLGGGLGLTFYPCCLVCCHYAALPSCLVQSLRACLGSGRWQ